MAKILRVVFGPEDLQASLDEIRRMLALPQGPETVEQLAEFRRFRLFEKAGPYVRLMGLARELPGKVWAGIGTSQDLPATELVRQNALKIVKRWTMTKTWEKHPPEQCFSIRFAADETLNQRTVPRSKKTPRAPK